MKLVIQRVKSAKVTVKESGEVAGEINKGLFVLLGVGKEDTEKTADMMVEKLATLRIMADSQDKMNLSVEDVDGEVLVVSQFTLYADTSGGRRPSFVGAAEPELAKQVYMRFVEKLREYNLRVSTGSFGNYMEIENVADGPVTIILES